MIIRKLHGLLDTLGLTIAIKSARLAKRMPFFEQLNLKSRTRISFWLFFLVILIAYSNSFHSSWHLDDYHAIVSNPKLKIKDLKFSTLQDTFRAWSAKGAYNSDRLYRPIPNLTFGLNWYFGKDNVFGYHLVNFFVHCLTASVLYLIIKDLFQTPRLKKIYPHSGYAIPFFAALLWAVNPIQTQAVTYIVQRMAAMAAMFFLMGMFCYIRGRLRHDSATIRTVWYVFSVVFFFIAILSKQNTVLWPLSIGLIEILFFLDINILRSKALVIGILFCFAILIFLVSTVYFLGENLSAITNMYANRPFTPNERLLTEFRVLIFYLALIFFPSPQRLSIEHDFIISSSIFQPWTTLPSILLVVGLIGFSIFKIRKFPIISFSILFFFINHLIESSIIGLELVFEHRNYLPSAFLFFPVAVGFHQLINRYKKKNQLVYMLVQSTLVFIVLGFVAGTFARNTVWRTEKSLWEDALQKAPEASRPYHNLAWAHYERNGDYQNALLYYQEALKRGVHHDLTRTALIGNMAAIHYRTGNYKEAIRIWENALEIDPNDEVNRYGLASALIKAKEYGSALETINILTTNRNDNSTFWALKGFVLLKMERYDEAEHSIKLTLRLNPGNETSRLILGALQNLQGDYPGAESTLRTAHKKMPRNIELLLWLIDTNLRLSKDSEAREYMEKLLKIIDSDRLHELFESQPEENFILFSRSKAVYEKNSIFFR